jgi:hypothetical protein
MKNNPRIQAFGYFGSAAADETWEYSDIDVYVIVDGDQDLWEGRYLKRDGVLVHLQLLSSAVLRKQAEKSNGGPFFAALASVVIWFDRSGEFSRAVEQARKMNDRASRLRACREICACIDALHNSEKLNAKRKPVDSRVALVTALTHMLAARLARAGEYPPAAVWSAPVAAEWPEHLLLERAFSTPDHTSLIAEIWEEVRRLLSEGYARPITDLLAESGPLSLEELDASNRLPGVSIAERVMIELVNMRTVIEVEVLNCVLGICELKYSLPVNSPADVTPVEG